MAGVDASDCASVVSSHSTAVRRRPPRRRLTCGDCGRVLHSDRALFQHRAMRHPNSGARIRPYKVPGGARWDYDPFSIALSRPQQAVKVGIVEAPRLPSIPSTTTPSILTPASPRAGPDEEGSSDESADWAEDCGGDDAEGAEPPQLIPPPWLQRGTPASGTPGLPTCSPPDQCAADPPALRPPPWLRRARAPRGRSRERKVTFSLRRCVVSCSRGPGDRSDTLRFQVRRRAASASAAAPQPGSPHRSSSPECAVVTLQLRAASAPPRAVIWT
eukprot:TRINITY_DN9773_c0_g1_i1.p1 TRINITY_DN9773_c0_g1~~TRINITY_DN9773_c0_g1_i1.p1  ORF type:complete len:311 (+),score=61.06 TRINITY_DN9773_c0_g1_i1:116-934(+)